MALNYIILFSNLDLAFDILIVNWSFKALLCNNLSQRNKRTPVTQPSYLAELL